MSAHNTTHNTQNIKVRSKQKINIDTNTHLICSVRASWPGLRSMPSRLARCDAAKSPVHTEHTAMLMLDETSVDSPMSFVTCQLAMRITILNSAAHFCRSTLIATVIAATCGYGASVRHVSCGCALCGVSVDAGKSARGGGCVYCAGRDQTTSIRDGSTLCSETYCGDRPRIRSNARDTTVNGTEGFLAI